MLHEYSVKLLVLSRTMQMLNMLGWASFVR